MCMFPKIKTAFFSLLILLLPTTGFAAQGDFFPVRSGLSAGPMSNGTGSSNEFNRFTNSTPTLPDFRGQSRSDQNHWDERDFVTAKKMGVSSGYDHEVSGLALGDQVWVEVYIHNNAEQTCNNQNKTNNTSVKLDWSTPQSLVGSISSADATPQTINDIVSFSFNGDYSFQRVLSQGVLVVDREQPNSGFCSGTPANYDYKTTSLSSSDTNLTSEVNIGTVNGSYAHVKGVFFLLEVVPAIHNLEITKTANPTPETTINTGNNITYSLTATNTGNVGLQNVTLTDTLDQNLQYTSGDTGVSINDRTVTLSYGDLGSTPETLSFGTQVRTITANGARVCNSATGSARDLNTIASNEICHPINNPNDVCGNNVRNDGEQCDDGNQNNGDGCDDSCMWEYDGDCGNGQLEGPEECDDGNNNSGDGCSAICIDEDGTPTCGNGIWEETEQCDDGNTISGDGCSATCQDEGNDPDPDDGGGGGGAVTNPTIGTCTVHESTGASQCTPRYPVEDTDDLDWQNYDDCREDSTQTVRDCLINWAENKGYRVCGDGPPGIIDIPYTGGSNADLVAQCDETTPPVNPGQPCDEIAGAITKEIKHINNSVWNDDEAFIPKGDFVDYRVSVNFDATPYISSTGNVTSGTISIYDYTDYLGTSNPPVWERAGIVTEGWEPWIAGGIKHEQPLTSGQIAVLNATGQFTKTIRYRAHTNLMSDQDVFTVGNDAFAMLRLRVDTIDPLSGTTTTGYQQLAAGGNLCTIGAATGGTGTVSGVDVAEGTLGDDATAHIIRPFVEVRGGDAAFRFSDSTTSATQRVTGDAAAITGDTLSSGSVYVESTTPSHLSNFSDNTSFSSLADFEEFSGTANSDAFFDNLKNNLSPVLENINGITNAQFSTTLGETNVYFIANTGAPTITGNLDMNGSSKTFIIDNGEDLIINSNFTITNGYAAFIVRNGGNIIIDKDVTEIEGIFIAEGSEITTSVDPTSWQFEQSYYQLTVSGMLVGDMRNLFSYRKFIGVSLMTLNDLQPNVLLLFDLRLLLATPPALEKVLGEGWRQDIEIE